MLKTLTELKSVHLLDSLEQNFDQAENIGVLEERLWVAILLCSKNTHKLARF